MRTKLLARTALFAALTAVGAFIKIPLGVSSITLQFFFTAMAGCLLGPVWGTVSQGVYVLLGLVGLPIFTMGGGFGYIFQPTFGFLLGLIPSTAAVALLTCRGAGRIRLFLGCLAGDLVLYLFGVPYMYLILHLYTGSDTSMAALLTGMLVYVSGDLVKLAVLTGLSPVLRRRLAGYLP